MVAKMAAGQKQVPLEHCPFIQAYTAGQVRCEELRPDQAEYFALIRRQSAGDAAPSLPAGLVEDRRVDHATAAQFANTMFDRRREGARAGEG